MTRESKLEFLGKLKALFDEYKVNYISGVSESETEEVEISFDTTDADEASACVRISYFVTSDLWEADEPRLTSLSYDLVDEGSL